MKIDLNRVAEGIRCAFATGVPFSVPVMTMRELGQLMEMLRVSEQQAA